MTHDDASPQFRPQTRTATLPTRLRLLFIAGDGGAANWLSEAIVADGAAQITIETAAGAAHGLSRLRDEAFDAILASHEPASIDAIEFAAALRTGGHDEPLVVIGVEPPAALDALCYEAGADDYCCLAETTVRGLLWKLARAIQRFTLTRDNRRLVQAERHRLQQEHHEAERLLDQQRALITDLEELSDGPKPAAVSLALATPYPGCEGDDPLDFSAATVTAPPHDPPSRQLPSGLVSHYRELLQAYVIMGAGNLSHEMSTLAAILVDANVSAQRAMRLHLQVLEELVHGLGNRSARHVMNRADLLALEIMSHLADGYRQRYDERRYPPQQQLLPGFDSAAA